MSDPNKDTPLGRIVRLEVANLMRLRAVEIMPDGAVVLIGGKNAQGKTSVLNAIQMALGGTKEVPEMPIHTGNSKGHVIVETADMVITRTFSAAGGSTLEIRNAQGAKLASPQTLLDKLTSKVSFDPLAFTRLKDDAQLETVRKIAGLDFTVLDANRKTHYDERTLKNREVNNQSAKLGILERHADAPPKALDIAELMLELEEAQAHNKQAEILSEALSELNDGIDAKDVLVLDLKRQIEELNSKVELEITARAEMVTVRDQKKTELDEFKGIDDVQIRDSIVEAQGKNEKVLANAAWSDANRLLVSLTQEAQELTNKIEAIDLEKETLLKGASFPIGGLSFGDTGVTFNGLPFKQASGAEQLRVSLSIATAMNPQLPVMLIRDGSLLDTDSMKLVAEHAEKTGAQVWIEVVGDREDAAVIIEDGAVAEPKTPKGKKK